MTLDRFENASQLLRGNVQARLERETLQCFVPDEKSSHMLKRNFWRSIKFLIHARVHGLVQVGTNFLLGSGEKRGQKRVFAKCRTWWDEV